MATEKGKYTKNVGLWLTEEQHARMKHIIRTMAPSMKEGQLARIAWLDFEARLAKYGPMHIVGDAMGA